MQQLKLFGSQLPITKLQQQASTMTNTSIILQVFKKTNLFGYLLVIFLFYKTSHYKKNLSY